MHQASGDRAGAGGGARDATGDAREKVIPPGRELTERIRAAKRWELNTVLICSSYC